MLTHTEVSAALMACASAELTGVPGVVVVGNGPGLASVVNGAAHAHLDRVPLLVISDRYTEAEVATTGHQILDQRALLAPVVKWSATLTASSAAETLDRALALTLAAPCGPVHLDLPRTVGREHPRRPTSPRRPPPRRTSPRHPRAHPAGLRRDLRLRPLRRAPTPSCSPASRPRGRLTPCSGGAGRRLGAPVLTTLQGQGRA